MVDIGWQFPKTNWGSESGKNDPGLETFRGNPYPSLAREPIQNSIDAHDGSDNPVRVEFTVFKIPNSVFPNRSEYIDVLKRCISEAKSGSDTQKEMNKALETIEQDEIYFMKISDYNTVGLDGSDQLRDSNWHRLIKVVGESEKDETSGGAFGIGKHAPFVCSDLKAVFYSTKDQEGKRAFQGVSKLISFIDEDGEPRQATGFYGELEKAQPIKNMTKVKNLFIREKVGTDLFVAGFDYRDTWIDEIIEAVINSFFVAIVEGSLEVKVGKELINKDSLDTYIKHLTEIGSKSNAIKYYEVLTSTNSTFVEEENFEGLGKVQLYLAIKTNYNKKIAMVRKTGMVIKEKQNYQIPSKYAGVLLIKGDAFNKELKRIENPTHTDWELSRKKDVKIVKATLAKLNKWMNEQIKSISPYKEVDSFDVDELSQFLPDENLEMQFDIDLSNGDGERGEPLESDLEKGKPEDKRQRMPSEDGDEENLKKKRKQRQEKNPHPKPPKPYNPTKTAEILKYKLFCTDPQRGKYRINLNAKNDGNLTIQLEMLGDSFNIPAVISKAISKGKKLPVHNENIGPFTVTKGANQIEFELAEQIRVAMGVDFNGK